MRNLRTAVRMTAIVLCLTAGWPARGLAESRVEIHFQGTRNLSPGQLRSAAADELAVIERPGQLAANVEDAAYAMQRAYHEAGYAFAEVEGIIEGSGSRPRVTFRVEEGPLVTLQALEFEGNRFLDDQQLQAFYQVKRSSVLPTSRQLYVESRVSEALASLRNFYLSAGYLDFAVDPPEVRFSEDRRSAEVQVTLREGQAYRIQEVRFEGDLLPEAATARGDAAREFEGEPYYRRQESLLKSRILERYADLGYPDATVDVTAAEGGDGKMTLTAEVASGPQVRIAGIVIRGNVKTSSEFIFSRMQLRPGDVFSQEKQRASFTALYRTGLFSVVNVELAEEPGGEKDFQNLLVTVKESPSREVYLEPGWGSYEFLRLQAGLRENNLFGSGRLAGLQAGASFKGYQATLTLGDPWLLGSEVNANLNTYARTRIEPAFTRQEVGNTLGFSLNLLPTLTAASGYTYRYTRLVDVAADADLADLEANYRVAALSLSLVNDTRNNVLYPESGIWSLARAEFSHPLIGSQIPFSRVSAAVRWFVPLGQTTVLATRYETGFIVPGAGQILVPVGERFYNGGESTVRSFYESEIGPVDPAGNPMGGLGSNVFTFELRQRVYANILASVFADVGNITPNRSRTLEGVSGFESRTQLLQALFEDYFREFRYGLGAGLQYLLPVGPARLDVAVNPSPRRERNEGTIAVHFSIGMAF